MPVSWLEAVLEELRPDDGTIQRRKYVVPAAAKPRLLHRLHHMHVTAATLFPGVDGLGSELMEMARLPVE